MKETRIDASRARLAVAFFYALGSYQEQEAKKEDVWRDQNWWQKIQHIKHEFTELERSTDLTKQLHNAVDLSMLALILLATLMDEAGLFPKR